MRRNALLATCLLPCWSGSEALIRGSGSCRSTCNATAVGIACQGLQPDFAGRAGSGRNGHRRRLGLVILTSQCSVSLGLERKGRIPPGHRAADLRNDWPNAQQASPMPRPPAWSWIHRVSNPMRDAHRVTTGDQAPFEDHAGTRIPAANVPESAHFKGRLGSVSEGDPEPAETATVQGLTPSIPVASVIHATAGCNLRADRIGRLMDA